MKKQLLELRVNGRLHEIAIEPNRLLLDALRLDLQLTGSKRGCDDSSCGACTVLVDGVPMLSCTMLAASCEGQEITTVEGVAEHGALAAIQKAYGDWGGAQCGFCTPGFMMTVTHLLATNSNPTDAEIREALSSNLCRCTGYSQMYEAVKAAIEAEKNGAVVSEWQKIFEPDSRSLLDIWVFDASRADWQKALDWLARSYPIIYSEDAAPAPLPSFEAIWERHKATTQLLRIDLGGFAVNAHFFSPDEIEMNVLPEDVDSRTKAESVFKFAIEIARLLNKEVAFAPEYGSATTAELKAMAFCTVSPDGTLSLGTASREIFR